MSNVFRRLRFLGLACPSIALIPVFGLAQGILNNGANVSGSIAGRTQTNTWSFSANKGDDITVSLSETGTNTAFVPQFQLLGPGAANYGYSWGDLRAQRHITAAATGSYTVLVSRYDYATNVGHYLLTLAKSPEVAVVPPDDQGGPMNNGQNYSGTILRGDLDQWTFSANKGDDVTVSVSEVGTNTAFVPELQVIGPDGVNYGYSWGDLRAQRHLTALATGPYKVVVSRYDYSDGVGSYVINLARSPAAAVVSSGDQGGALTIGQNYPGAILRGDLDQWTFSANKGDDVTVSVSEVGTNTAFVPELQVIGPDGVNYGYSWGDLRAQRHITALSSGSYKVVVSRYDAADGTGNYLLTLAKSPGTFVVPGGDEGGALTDGQSYAGKILRGDLDLWSLTASKGDDVTVTISQAGTNTSFIPEMQLIGPDGTNYGYSWGALRAERHITAGQTGAYTVVVSRYDYADGVGDYLLTMSKSPGTFVVPLGDQGGAMNNGQNYSGTLLRGDLDQWSFNANKGDDITVSLSESGVNTAFVPEMQVIGPDGTDYGYSWGDLQAKRHITANETGAYKIVVSRYDYADGVGSYLLTLARSPASFVISNGDQGGTMALGQNYAGTILRGDLDQWTFIAAKGASLTVSVSETGTNTAFVPEFQIIGPDGSDYGYAWGDLAVERRIVAATSGAYKVVVSRYDYADGPGNYSLSVR